MRLTSHIQLSAIDRMRLPFLMAALGLLLLLNAASVHANTVVLNNNSGSDSTIWFITGEPSLVMNGFDLGPLGLNFPVSVSSVSISVETPIPNTPIDVVVYQDSTGGSPIDATLVGRTQVQINQAGTFTARFEEPVQVNAPVVWVGFYLPIDFEFRADTSGTSVLTYWAWQPGGTFDLADLPSAGVFGPANGSAPVNLDMGGVARITAELTTDGTQPATGVSATTTTVQRDDDDRIVQVVGSSSVNLSPMVPYTNCENVYRDVLDISVTYRNAVRFFCQLDNIRFSPATPEGYSRRGLLYDVYAFGLQSPGTDRMPFPVTHCIRPAEADLNRAVIGLGYGAPRQWEILPSVRFGEIVCAELHYTGFVSYFVPN